MSKLELHEKAFRHFTKSSLEVPPLQYLIVTEVLTL